MKSLKTKITSILATVALTLTAIVGVSVNSSASAATTSKNVTVNQTYNDATSAPSVYNYVDSDGYIGVLNLQNSQLTYTTQEELTPGTTTQTRTEYEWLNSYEYPNFPNSILVNVDPYFGAQYLYLTSVSRINQNQYEAVYSGTVEYMNRSYVTHPVVYATYSGIVTKVTP